jgi:hypothetical protein
MANYVEKVYLKEKKLAYNLRKWRKRIQIGENI